KTLEELKQRPERERRWHKEGFPPNVVCRVAAGTDVDFTSLRPGDRVELIGRVVGRKTADVWHDYVVLLDACRSAGPGKEGGVLLASWRTDIVKAHSETDHDARSFLTRAPSACR